jgi:hypothetical protein
MTKRMLIVMILPMLILGLAGMAQAWQGRMGGMGDPYGLISDESDFFVNPAGIVKGEGIRFYGDYRFLYTGVTAWDVDFTSGAGVEVPSEMSGRELRHNVLVGAGFPLGPGRMGLFFTYDGRRGGFDGDLLGSTMGAEYTSDLDAFALRLLYGIPIGSFTLGGELGFAYRQEENKSFVYASDMSGGIVNIALISPLFFPYSSPFMPYDSAYWEIPFKAGVAGAVGPLDVGLTARGGVIVAGDNTFRIESQAPVGVVTGRYDLDGDVQGWRIGGDLWVRYPLARDLSLPFLVRVDYQDKTRDGDTAFPPYDYDNEESSLHLVVGGGLDKELAQGTRVSGGIYYGYLHDTADYSFTTPGPSIFTSSDYPDLTEHRGMVRLAGEHAFSPMVALRMGLEGFYGWAMQDLTFSLAPATYDISSGGSHWGIGASLGGSIKVRPITLEPFFNVGYQSLDLSGDGKVSAGGVPTATFDRDDTRNQWNIGGGLSVLFDVP